MKPGNKNSYNSLKALNINGKEYKYYSLVEAEKNGLEGISKLPKSLKVILENNPSNNPKTSRLTAMSIILSLNKRKSSFLSAF